jgi:pyridoxamine 5'-phosphate oxidase
MPISKCQTWLEEAGKHPQISEPTAMTLATIGADNKPSARIVLLKQLDENGFVFFTNLAGRKSREIKHNPQAALCFYWEKLERQLRVEGHIVPLDDAASDAYFASRMREKQVGAWASAQSEIMTARSDLGTRIAEISARFDGQIIPRPPHWGGWRLSPAQIEFWQQGDYRWHSRELFTLDASGNWQSNFLYP